MERFEHPLYNITIPLIAVYNEKINDKMHHLSPVLTQDDFNNGFIGGIKTKHKTFFKHWFDFIEMYAKNFDIGIEDRNTIKTLKSGDVFTFDGYFTVVEVILNDCIDAGTYYEARPTGIFNIKKNKDKNSLKKIISLSNTRLKRYTLTTHEKNFEELFTSNIKDMLLIGATPNTTGVYLAALMFDSDTSFYVDDIQRLTGWDEMDIQRGLNELEELGEVLLDSVYENIDGEDLPKYFQNEK